LRNFWSIPPGITAENFAQVCSEAIAEKADSLTMRSLVRQRRRNDAVYVLSSKLIIKLSRLFTYDRKENMIL
jgi:hypothetical protein